MTCSDQATRFDDRGLRPEPGWRTSPWRVAFLATAAIGLGSLAGCSSTSEEADGPVTCGDLGTEAPVLSADPTGSMATAPELDCTQPGQDGSSSVFTAEVLACTDGSALVLVDRTMLDGLPEDEQVQVWARTGEAWQTGVPSDAERTACEGA